MEVALATPSLDMLALLAPVASGGLPAVARAAAFPTDDEREAFARLLAFASPAGWPAPTRVCFGHETCEHLVPPPDDWLRALDVAARHGLALTAVLPPTRASGEDPIASLLDLLARSGAVTEVTCADWGTAALVSRAGLRPVLGRIMNRMKRFERWTAAAPVPASVDDPSVLGRQLRVARQSPLLQPPALALAASLGACRVDLDPVPQGVRVPPGPLPVGVGVHVPWTLVTLGRRCLVRAAAAGAAAAGASAAGAAAAGAAAAGAGSAAGSAAGSGAGSAASPAADSDAGSAAGPAAGPGARSGSRPVAGGGFCPAPCRSLWIRPVFDDRMPATVQRGNAVFQANPRFLPGVVDTLPPDVRFVVRPLLG
ncbi:MAG: hypothetical protein FJ087_21200 [Deltaproteobacteria bacterium]|nr:hypothetical protein [Deltaproteobacteria bacterium]